uniref:carboxyltransferase domain-containing protein n=1 Tax=Shewanella sp. TaxID=50422 RepID=UPI004048C747
DTTQLEFDSRVVHLPLSWDDEACKQAIEKYIQSVRKDAPWCPSNLEFIKRINGLNDIEQVKDIVFDASYLVLGLGDVYLGAPVATPYPCRHPQCQYRQSMATASDVWASWCTRLFY